MQKRVSIIVAFILGLVLTVLGGHNFLNIKSGYHQTFAPQNQPAIQLELPDRGNASNEPAWTLTNQTTTPNLRAHNLVNVRGAAGYRNRDHSARFFIAGVIDENQSADAEQKAIFFNNTQPQVVEAGYAHPANSRLAIN